MIRATTVMVCKSAALPLAVLVLVVVGEARTESVRWPSIRPLNLDSRHHPELSAYRETSLEHSTVEEVIEDLQVRNMVNSYNMYVHD